MRAFAARVVAAGAVFILNVIIARQLGAANTGLFYLGLSVVGVAAVLARLGLDSAVVRFVAAHAGRAEWSAIAAIYRRYLAVAVCSAAGFALLLYIGSNWLSREVFAKPELGSILSTLAIALVPFVIVVLHSQFLQGIRRAALGLYAQTALVQTLLLLLLLGLMLSGVSWSVVDLTTFYATVAVLAAVAMVLTWWRSAHVSVAPAGKYNFAPFRKSAKTLFPVAVMDQIVQPWAPVVALGIWADAAQVGLFVAANRLAALVSFAILPVNTMLAPKVSALTSEKDFKGVQHLSRRAMLLISLVAVPLIVPLVFATDRIMTLFGSEFAAGGSLLLILVVGQAVNVITGPARTLLVMTGHERLYRRASMMGGIIILIGCFLWVPDHGGIGAAAATAAGLIATKVFAAIMVRSRLRELAGESA
ncbi:MAG: oligosaccharide flippase family protein [Gammaproteobacteria bacterium]|nr:oligosaccharide flippase family protein [Gammaproteobacteria bacterium]